MRKKYFALLCGSIVAAIVLFTSVIVVSAITIPKDYGLGETVGKTQLKKTTDARVLVGDVIGGALSFVGILFFGLMLYGGFLWMTARGDEGRITKGKETIISAVIGLVIVLSSYAITQFIFESVTNNTGGPTVAADAKCVAQNEKYACQNIANCTFVFGDTEVERIKNCTPGNECYIGLCPGGNEIVCCDAGIE
ncbi:pilin [Patescibacteria group bacterium]|nr:pilin [Patescibacteria group bacterium]MBU1721252.1 pilin [Patescibacteria group bacterium]MBU1901040.1 pilin [Patescibacteria group bacterium]